MALIGFSGVAATLDKASLQHWTSFKMEVMYDEMLFSVVFSEVAG